MIDTTTPIQEEPDYVFTLRVDLKKEKERKIYRRFNERINGGLL